MLEQVRIATSPVISYVQTNSEVLEWHSYTSAHSYRNHIVMVNLSSTHTIGSTILP